MNSVYIPKVTDPVFIGGKRTVGYVATKVDEKKQTADLRTASDPPICYRDVAWANLYELRDRRWLARIIGEARVGC